MDGYYRNTLVAWQAELQKRQRLLMAHHGRLEGKLRPEYASIGRLIDLNKYLLEIVTDKRAKAEAE